MKHFLIAVLLCGVIYLIGIVALIIEFWKILRKNEDGQSQ